MEFRQGNAGRGSEGGGLGRYWGIVAVILVTDSEERDGRPPSTEAVHGYAEYIVMAVRYAGRVSVVCVQPKRNRL